MRWLQDKSYKGLQITANTQMKYRFRWRSLSGKAGQSPAVKTQLDQALSNLMSQLTLLGAGGWIRDLLRSLPTYFPHDTNIKVGIKFSSADV